MKKFRKYLVAGAALAAMIGFAGGASAATLDLSALSVANNQNMSHVLQAGGALDINVGNVSGSNLATSVTNAGNVNDVTASLDQTNANDLNFSGFGINANGALLTASNLGVSNVQAVSDVAQIGLAVTGSGGVGASTLATSVTNALNVNSVKLTVKQ